MVALIEHYGWVEWLCHSNFSFLMGASHPHELVARADALGYRGMALTDYDGVYGAARTHNALMRQRLDPGYAGKLQLIHGTEIHLAEDHALPLLLQDTLALIATTHRGYHNLCTLLTYAHRGGKNGAHIPPAYLLTADVQDLIAIIPMRGLLRRGGEVALRSRCTQLREHFNGRVYCAISRHLNPAEDHWMMPMMKLAKDLSLPCLLTNDVYMHERSAKDMSDLLHAIRNNQTVGNVSSHLFPNGERSMHDLKTIAARYQDLPIYAQALATGRSLAETCTFDCRELRYRYPKEMLPDGVSAQEYLEQITWQGAQKHYGLIPSKLETLLRHELALIEQLSFADYFLTVWDIVRWARQQGILCQGRGSAANSAVCFVLGVTAVDPNLFDLLFERFISVERGDPPDIDVDFEHERREEVIQYIYQRYGRGRAAMIANVITFRTRGAIRAVGKALGYSNERLEQAGKLLSSRDYRRSDCGRTITELPAEDTPTSQQQEQDAHWARLAERLRGFPRHLGIHSGGFMLTDRTLNWLVPQEPATMPGRTVIQWCKEDIEALGFFKIDILALGILTAIRKTFALVKEHQGQDLSLATIPANDRPTYDMICKADTVGTFQIESRAQMSMLPRLQPRKFYDLVIEVAIIRPGPIQGGMVHPFLRRRHGEEAVTFPDARLAPILQRTLGVPIFQEQVMRIAMTVGNFTPGEADQLRKNMGAFAIKGDLSRWGEKLQEGMRKNGIAEEFVQQILGQIRGFADYGFPESHAASFALLAYASSYLKRHAPAAYFTALLNSQPMGFYPPHVLIHSARQDGVKILPISVAHSHWDHTIERSPNGDLAIRLGMRLVRSLRKQAAQQLSERRGALGGWRDLLHMLRSCSLNRVDLTALAAADALHIFSIDRRSALWLAAAAPFCEFLEDVESPPDFQAETTMERCQSDFYATTTSLGPHPAAIIREHWCYGVPVAQLRPIQALATLTPQRGVIVFGMVLVRQSPPSAKGMVFMTLEDETGMLNVAATPQLYARYRSLIDGQAFLCVRGVLQRQHDAVSVLITEVLAPEIQAAKVVHLEQGSTAKSSSSSALTAHELIDTRNYL